MSLIGSVLVYVVTRYPLHITTNTHFGTRMLKLALQNLLSRPVRSLLALMGLTVAIVGMVGLFSVAEGIDDMVHSTFDQIPGLTAMQPGAPIPIFSRLPASWGDEIARLKGIRCVNPEIWSRVNVIDGKNIIAPPRFFFGVGIEERQRLRKSIYRDSIVEGRYLNNEDVGTLNTIISKPIADEFNKTIGDKLVANGAELTIIGIYHCNMLLLDVAIIVDIDQIRAITQFNPDSVCNYYIEQTGEVGDDELIEQIESLFEGREPVAADPMATLLLMSGQTSNPVNRLFTFLDGQLKSTPPNLEPNLPNQTTEDVPAVTRNSQNPLPIEIRRASDWADRFDEFTGDLDIFLTIMTGIGVTIAILSIINTMLMSVTERIIEFGILQANGWTKGDIVRLITFESALLGIGGGVLGITLGWTGTQVINWNWPEHVHLFASPTLLAFSLCFSIVLGMMGGLYPAIWATRMSPMEAIRRG